MPARLGPVGQVVRAAVSVVAEAPEAVGPRPRPVVRVVDRLAAVGAAP